MLSDREIISERGGGGNGDSLRDLSFFRLLFLSWIMRVDDANCSAS